MLASVSIGKKTIQWQNISIEPRLLINLLFQVKNSPHWTKWAYAKVSVLQTQARSV